MWSALRAYNLQHLGSRFTATHSSIAPATFARSLWRRVSVDVFGSPRMSSTEEVRAYVFARSERELKGTAKIKPRRGPSSESVVAEDASAPTSAATAASANPLYGFGSKLMGAARKTEARRLRGFLALTKAEQRPIGELFSEVPTRQIYLVSAQRRSTSAADCQ